MNIVLIGYRGTGKSAVGRLIAEKLNMKCVGMDAAIEERTGMPIPEIVKKLGWPGFRDQESALVRELSAMDHLVIDCGGGVIERPENIEALRENAVIVWLKASVSTIVSRIEHSTNRPALVEGKTFTEEVAEVLERRTPKYRSAAGFEIDTDTLTPAQITEKVVGFYKGNANKKS